MISSCGVKQYIPEDELLYTGSELKLDSETKIKDRKRLKEELENLFYPEPNSKFLGMRLGLWAHYKAQKEKPGFINRFINKKIGEEPVYLSDVNIPQTEELINNRLENRGFFRNEVVSSENRDEKTASVKYTATVRQPYTLKTYQLDTFDSVPGYEKQLYEEIKSNLDETIIKPDARYDLALLKAERERIDKHLKLDGYYNFNADFLIFEVDTNRYDNKGFDLFLRLKREVPEKSKIPYNVNSVNVFPNYSIETDSIAKDTVSLDGINFIQETTFFKPKRLAPYILIKKGERYDPKASQLTSNRLSSIGTYKFVNIRYDEIDTQASDDGMGMLDANIYLSPLNKRAIRAELQAVSKSNNFAGPTLSLTYTNRNLFRGGETLNITGKVGYEMQIGGGDNKALSSTQLGLTSDLIFPRLIFPIKIVDQFEYAIPKTKVSLGAEYLNRSQLFSLNSFTGTFGYNWNANKYVYHELNPFSINYVNLSRVTDEFQEILDNNPFLQGSFEQKFIAGLTYSFTYNELVDANKKHPLFFNANLDIAGNVLKLLSGGKSTFLGLEYAQYAKTDVDIRYHLRLGSAQTLVARLFGGIGIPYGNSETLPFSKQYFSGGPYSVRAFRIRSLGPGSYRPEAGEAGTIFNQSGDIRLEANLEYRFPIYSFLKGAVFADAGNVWILKENDALPGGKFNSDFMSELGVGAGVGLRVDIQNFVIRFDLAAPIQKPFLDEGERLDFDISSPILNFAIGYPF